MTATDCDGLLAAVLAAPGDDLPRLVLADRMDEHADDPCGECHGSGRDYRVVNPGCDNESDYDNGPCKPCSGSGKVAGRRERAEFIRVQCELAKWTDADGYMPMGLGRERLRVRESDLINAHCYAWFGRPAGALVTLGHLADQLRDDLSEPGWAFVRRGFIVEIRLPLAAFLAHARDLFAAHPIERVVITNLTAFRSSDGRYRLYPPLDDLGETWRTVERSPYPIWRQLEAGSWKTAAEADAALSRACVTHGRRTANLPPLDG